MRRSYKLTCRLIAATAFSVFFALLATSASRAYVNASGDSKESATTNDSRLRLAGLQGSRAVDYLKQHGLFDRIKASVEARQLVTGRLAMRADQANNRAQNLEASVPEVKRLTASDGSLNDAFGLAVAISGDVAVVGAEGDDLSRGAAYVFYRNKGGTDNWGQIRKLTASDGVPGDSFGHSVGISGDRLVIGAPYDDGGKGSAYVFARHEGGVDNWGEVKKVSASDGALLDNLGISVGISGDMVVAGAFEDDDFRGSAYVFERHKGGFENWGQVRKLTASDGSINDLFGASVAISGDLVVVGAYRDDTSRGAAYVFQRNKGGTANWGEVRKLTASDRAGNDQLGRSVAISGGRVVAGAPFYASFRGAAYIFDRNKGGTDNWGEVKKMTVPGEADGDYLGISVAVNDETVIVGAFGEDSYRGSAYIFDRNKGGVDNWGETWRLTASDGSANDSAGFAAGVSGDQVVVGAFRDDSYKGSAYIFNVFPEAVSVSAASFQRAALAPEMIAAAFGTDLANSTQVAGGIPLPTNLRGTTVSVKDSTGFERLAQLFFVSPGQVNYYIPVGTATGPATVKITSGSGQVSFGAVDIAAISPGIVSANATGQGVAAALVLRVSGLQQTYEQISAYNAATNTFVPIPIDFGPPGDQVFLVIYGTGFRFRTSDSSVNVKVGGRTLQSLFSGIAAGYVGLDQLNISALPRDLAGAGVVNIEITIDGKAANTTTASIK